MREKSSRWHLFFDILARRAERNFDLHSLYHDVLELVAMVATNLSRSRLLNPTRASNIKLAGFDHPNCSTNNTPRKKVAFVLNIRNDLALRKQVRLCHPSTNRNLSMIHGHGHLIVHAANPAQKILIQLTLIPSPQKTRSSFLCHQIPFPMNPHLITRSFASSHDSFLPGVGSNAMSYVDTRKLISTIVI